MAKVFYIFFLLLSFISHTITEPGIHILWSRVTYADVFGAIALVLTFPKFKVALKSGAKIPWVYKMGFLMIGGLAVTALFSLYPLITIVEVGIILFLLLISVGIFLTFKELPVLLLFTYLMVAVIIFTGIGFYDLFAEEYGFTRVFPLAKYPGVWVSGFKNTGQAGSFYLIAFILLLPLRFSKLSAILSTIQEYLLNISLVCCVITFATLGKYSVIYGLLIGISLFVIFARKIKLVIITLTSIAFIFGLLLLLENVLPAAYGRVGFKFENRVVKNELNTKEVGFIQENFTAAITAFKESPITGCGLGTFQCKYHTHEVHSTYLKILGESGLIGTITYILFMIFFLKLFPISWKRLENSYAQYLQYLLPLLIGALVTWVYTYHLRKREFWILIAIVLVVAWKQRNNLLQNEKPMKL